MSEHSLSSHGNSKNQFREFARWQTQHPDFCSLFQHEPNVHITHHITQQEFQQEIFVELQLDSATSLEVQRIYAHF